MSEQTRPRMSRTRARDHGQSAAERIADAILFPVAVVRRVLPDHDVPVYLGAGALALAGVIDWPVAAAAGLGYAALKRWGRTPVEVGRQPTGPERYALRHDGDRLHGNPTADGEVRTTRRPMPRH